MGRVANALTAHRTLIQLQGQLEVARVSKENHALMTITQQPMHSVIPKRTKDPKNTSGKCHRFVIAPIQRQSSYQKLKQFHAEAVVEENTEIVVMNALVVRLVHSKIKTIMKAIVTK